MAKDSFGFGVNADHSTLWTEFTKIPLDSKEYQAFVDGTLKDKIALLQKFSEDTDDRLWRSDQWQSIVEESGEDEASAHKEYWNERR